jgi:hypothetical protein
MRTSLFFVAILALAAGCPDNGDPLPPTEDYTVLMAPEDLQTGMAPDVRPTVTLSTIWPWRSVEEFVERELPAWDRSLRFVRWPSGEPVPGRWVFSNGFPPLTFSFEAESELPDGWYATQMRFTDLPTRRGTFATAPQVLAGTAGPQVGSTVIDGWTTTRFHVGSMPIAQIWGQIASGGGEEGGGHIRLYITEEVSFAQEQEIDGLLHMTVDGVPVRCNSYGERLPAGLFLGIGWDCDDPGREGEVVVTLQPLAGAPPGLLYGSAESPPTWRIRTGEFFDPYDVPDSLFAVTAREHP